MTLQAVPSYEPWLTSRELADRLGVSVRTVMRMKADGMPYAVYGRRAIRFRESDAIRWGMMPSPKRRDHGRPR